MLTLFKFKLERNHFRFQSPFHMEAFFTSRTHLSVEMSVACRVLRCLTKDDTIAIYHLSATLSHCYEHSNTRDISSVTPYVFELIVPIPTRVRLAYGRVQES